MVSSMRWLNSDGHRFSGSESFNGIAQLRMLEEEGGKKIGIAR